jgi:hypothetical protein
MPRRVLCLPGGWRIQQACRDVPVGAPALPHGGPELSNGPTVANQRQRTAVAGPHDNYPPRGPATRFVQHRKPERSSGSMRYDLQVDDSGNQGGCQVG